MEGAEVVDLERFTDRRVKPDKLEASPHSFNNLYALRVPSNCAALYSPSTVLPSIPLEWVPLNGHLAGETHRASRVPLARVSARLVSVGGDAHRTWR